MYKKVANEITICFSEMYLVSLINNDGEFVMVKWLHKVNLHGREASKREPPPAKGIPHQEHQGWRY
jgi:hypothetical protein